MDILAFNIMTAEESGEQWLDNDKQKTIPVVQILINGTDLRTVVKQIELPFALLEEDLDIAEELAGAYGCIPVEELFHEMTQYPKDFALFVCSGCGISGCWSVICEMTQNDDSVFWKNFRHNHRDWHYPLEFQFTKENYLQQLEKLKSALSKEE